MKTISKIITPLLLFCLLTGCGKATATVETPASTSLPTEPQPSTNVVAAISLEEQRAITEQVLDDLMTGKVDATYALFNETMKKAITAEQLKGLWPQIELQYGAFDYLQGIQQSTVQGYSVNTATCVFENGTLLINVAFDDSGNIAGLTMAPGETPETDYRVPEYVDETKFTESEVTVGSGQWVLPGTLTLPIGEGPFPAVVLVHGSGPNDRDETIGPNRPFKDIAWGLASRGIAVLRYDKRTKAHANLFTEEVLKKLTLQDETITDALLAVDLLQQQAGIDHERIFVLGHSQGGLAAPRIGKQDAEIAGLIILAGPTRRFEDVILDQITYITNLDGELSQSDKDTIRMAEEGAALVKSDELNIDTSADQLPLGIPAGFWLDIRDYKPAEVAAGLSMPMLILQGGRDYQVTRVDFDGWQAALAGKSNVTLKFYPDLSHLFMTGAGMATPQEYNQPGTLSVEVIKDIADWILSLK
jgi:dienelactone hydrolase